MFTQDNFSVAEKLWERQEMQMAENGESGPFPVGDPDEK